MTLIIPRGISIAEPIDLRTQNIAQKLIIILEPSSSATIIHGSIASPTEATIERNIQCIVQENASLIMRYDEEWQPDLNVFTQILIEQHASSVVHYTHSFRGGARIKQQLSLMVIGKNAQADIRGVYEITHTGSVDITTLQYHDTAHTRSNLLFKSIVRDAGQMSHHGTIEITKNGMHTESAQHTHTLLLSNQARAVSVPNIEVSTHEVQCGHGSAIGRLDEEQLWYLQARGLSREKAEEMLIHGFFNDVL
jgi:Fe-S cluster assembly protein SufD